MEMRKHIGLLGLKVKDRVTGLQGVCTSVSFDLYGCIQVIVSPGLDKDGKPRDGLWLDIGRLEAMSNKPVMPVPNFDFGVQAEGKQGPAEKPRTMKV